MNCVGSDMFELVTNQIIEQMKEVFSLHPDCKCEVYGGEYLKSVKLSNRFRNVRIDFDKIIPASMCLDQTVKLQVRVERDDWLDPVISLPISGEDIIPVVLEALNKYFNIRIDSVIKDLNILNVFRFS